MGGGRSVIILCDFTDRIKKLVWISLSKMFSEGALIFFFSLLGMKFSGIRSGSERHFVTTALHRLVFLSQVLTGWLKGFLIDQMQFRFSGIPANHNPIPTFSQDSCSGYSLPRLRSHCPTLEVTENCKGGRCLLGNLAASSFCECCHQTVGKFKN